MLDLPCRVSCTPEEGTYWKNGTRRLPHGTGAGADELAEVPAHVRLIRIAETDGRLRQAGAGRALQLIDRPLQPAHAQQLFRADANLFEQHPREPLAAPTQLARQR